MTHFWQAYRPHYIKTYQLAYPIVVGQISHILISVADNTMVGQHSSMALAAATFANSLFITVMMFGIGVTWALTPLVATADAAGKPAQAAALLKHSLAVYLGMGLALLLLIYSASLGMHLFGQNAEVTVMARPYLWIVGATIVPIMLFQGFKQWMDGLSHTKEPMYINFGAAMLNILLNYVFIFGHWGFPEMGLLGAAWATLIARVAALLAIALRYYTAPKFAGYRAHWGLTLQKATLGKLLRMGVPVGLQAVFETGAFAFVTIMAGWIGVQELAAHQIALNIATISFLTAGGIGAAGAIRTANFVGLRDRPNLQMAGKAVYHLTLVFMAVCGLLMAVLRHWLPTFYIDLNDPNAAGILSLSSSLLIYAAIFQLSDGGQLIGMNVLRGIQDVKVPTIIALVAYWVVGVPLAYVLAFVLGMGVQGIWLGLAVALTVAAVFLAVRFWDKSKRLALA